MSRCRSLVAASLAVGVVWGAPLAVPAAAEAKKRKHSEFGARILAQGAKGRDVRVLQDFLTRVGVATPVDGHFGRGTRARVRAWERRRASEASSSAQAAPRGLRVDGRLSRREARLLRAEVEEADATTEGAEQTEAQDLSAQTTPGDRATIAPDGTAVAPESAPDVVKRIIAAGNEIHDMPYRYGGGHKPPPNKDSGYDCSGSMSYAFQGAGLLKDALDSSGFARWGDAGPGEWVTIYANSSHSYMVVAGLRFDTSGRKDAGSRWQTKPRSGEGYTVRHPTGL